RARAYGWDALGQKRVYLETTRHVPYHPWMTGPLEPLPVTMPAGPAVLVLAVRLEDGNGTVLHRNFCSFVIEGAPPPEARLDAGPAHSRPEPEPERLSHDRRAPVPERRDGPHQRRGRGEGTARRRPRRSPRHSVVALSEARPAAPRGGLVRRAPAREGPT